MKKASAWAPVNLALVKYWGKKNEDLRIPANSSLSVCLSNLGTITTVKFLKDKYEDEVVIDGVKVQDKERKRVVELLERVRDLASINWNARVESKNNFAKGVGLSSSASGFAALSLAASKAIGFNLSEKDLSRLARKGSGSACRSIPSAWVEWKAGKTDEDSYAHSVFAKDYWDIRILVVLLSQEKKKVSSTDGHKVAQTSPYFKQRVRDAEKNLNKIKISIKKRDFVKFGQILEDEALSMHAVMLTSDPNLIYWLPETVRVMRKIIEWRQAGLESYFTINTGQNVFVLCLPKMEKELAERLSKIEGVVKVIKEKIGQGARLVENYLF